MSRPIKFRAMRTNGIWYHSSDRQSRFWSAFDDGYLKDETLGQFTGLLDKNGKEIYEGDVVKHEASVSFLQVVMPDCYDSLKHPKKWEVIGNVYESRCAELVMCGVYDNDPDQIMHHDKRCPAFVSSQA